MDLINSSPKNIKNKLTQNHTFKPDQLEIITGFLGQIGSPHTGRAVVRVLKEFFSYFKMAIGDITHHEINIYVQILKNDGLKPTTIRQRVSLLSSFFKYCEKTGIINDNPTRLANRPKAQGTDIRGKILSRDEVYNLIEAAKDFREQTLIKFLYMTGMRVSEVINLKWEHFFVRENDVNIECWGKRGKKRIIGITREFFEEVERLKSFNKSKYLVFENEAGGRLSPMQIRYVVKTAGYRAKIYPYLLNGKPSSHISPHWLRHTHATHLIENGAPIGLVQKSLGHTSLATTGIYIGAGEEGVGHFLSDIEVVSE